MIVYKKCILESQSVPDVKLGRLHQKSHYKEYITIYST